MKVAFIVIDLVWRVEPTLTTKFGGFMLGLFLFQIMFTTAANEGPVRVQYKCLVPIYVFPEMKLLFPKQNYNVLSPSSYTHISVRDLYISLDRSAYSAAGNMWTDP